MRHIFLFAFLFSSYIAFGQPTDPILKLNSVCHTGAVRNISSDADGRYLLTASEDKTARLWDARTGNALRVFRPPIGPGNEGCLYACALSPDGSTAAAGGFTGASWNKADSTTVTVGNWTGYSRQLKYSIYLFSTATGDLLLNIPDADAEILDLAYSPDGVYLAAALSDNKGVRIFKADNGMQMRNLIGYGGTVRKIGFSKSGQLASVADDGYLRLYDKSFRIVGTQPLESKPADVAFSPDESTIVVSYAEKNRISLFYTADLEHPKTLTLPMSSGKSAVYVAYASDGSLFTGEYDERKSCIATWKNNWRSKEISAGAGRIAGIRVLPDGSVAFATTYPEVGRVLPDNRIRIDREGKEYGPYLLTADMTDRPRYQREFFQLSDDGSKLGLMSVGFNSMLFFSIPDRELTTGPSSLPKAVDANREHKLRIGGWKGGRTLSLNSKDLQVLDKDEIGQCADVAKDGKYILAGTNRHVICLDNRGEVVWKQKQTDECTAVKIAGNGQSAVAALADGTYVWLDMKEGARILTLFVHPDRKRWILWTPAGYYDCSAGAEDLIGWNMNQGSDKAAAFFPVARFRNTFYRPDLIDRPLDMQYARLETGNRPTTETPAQYMPTDAPQKMNLAEALPPEVSIVTPQPESSVKTNRITLRYHIRNSENLPAESVKILIDGRPVQLLPSVPAGANEVSVEVPERDCEISVIAKNKIAASTPASVRLKWTGTSVENIMKPKLYVLAVGISKYNNKDFALQYAAKDAGDFAGALAKQKGLLYGDVSVKLLTDNTGNRANIMGGLEWIQRETTSRDVAMIFFAGHGVNDNTGNFFYMPAEADPERLWSTCINSAEIKQIVSSVAGKVVMFMDACHSGNVMGKSRRSAFDINGLVNELSSVENGAVVFTSSTGRQYSLEDPAWNNGAFTKALVEGLEGKADLFNRRSITVKTLDVYIAQRVKELTGGLQAPTTIVPESIPDFPIAVSK